MTHFSEKHVCDSHGFTFTFDCAHDFNEWCAKIYSSKFNKQIAGKFKLFLSMKNNFHLNGSYEID